jgi:hypothetical protein
MPFPTKRTRKNKGTDAKKNSVSKETVPEVCPGTNYGEKRVMGKAYWGVSSEFDAKGGLISAYLLTRLCAVKPRDRNCSRLCGVYFEDWFETSEEAVSYLDDVRGCAGVRTRAAG